MKRKSANEMNYHKTDQGIKQGYEWIVNYIDKNYEQLNIRVQMDILEQEIKEKEEMLERIRRIKAEREALSNNEDPDAIQTFSEYVSKMNGNAVRDTRELEVIDLCPNPEETGDIDNNTSDSSITFPEIYHINNYSSERERPKSAVQIVRHQLQMNAEMRRSQSAKTRRNKTAPLRQLAAKEFIPTDKTDIHVSPEKICSTQTANDEIFTISKSNIGPSGDFYEMSTFADKFNIQERFEAKKLPPLKVKSKAQINRDNDVNGICIVDVD